ncbi:carbohydrate ABC transporter permease [Neobacillus sp. NPDC058068]|uniref:carbohydrate ABC transporter permease n=1 Tax=Neobacillus sp. NPDC058068 TaxID=3346325 RepID=UPI0036D825AC
MKPEIGKPTKGIYYSTNLFTKAKNVLNSQNVVPYIFVLPFLLSFVFIYLYPLIKGFIMSFQSILPGEVEFIGLNNYKKIFNGDFYKALTNSTIYTILTVLILVVLPIIMAIFLNSSLVKFKTFFRAALFVPALTSTIVAGVIFRLMFGETDTAVANQILNWIGLESVDWKFNAWSGMALMVLLCSWRWMGVNTMYFLAGLQNIPKELYEAVEMDGANSFQKLWYITLPSLKPISIFVITISIISGFRMFEESFVFWESGSPGNIGLTIVGYIYQEGIRQNDLGFGSAIGIVLLLIIFLVSVFQLVVTGAFKKEGE